MKQSVHLYAHTSATTKKRQNRGIGARNVYVCKLALFHHAINITGTFKYHMQNILLF